MCPSSDIILRCHPVLELKVRPPFTRSRYNAVTATKFENLKNALDCISLTSHMEQRIKSCVKPTKSVQLVNVTSIRRIDGSIPVLMNVTLLLPELQSVCSKRPPLLHRCGRGCKKIWKASQKSERVQKNWTGFRGLRRRIKQREVARSRHNVSWSNSLELQKKKVCLRLWMRYRL